MAGPLLLVLGGGVTGASVAYHLARRQQRARTDVESSMVFAGVIRWGVDPIRKTNLTKSYNLNRIPTDPTFNQMLALLPNPTESLPNLTARVQ